MDNGWIQLHRKILENPIYRKPAWLSVWITLLLLASHKEKEDFIWNGKPLKLKQGEFITGRKRLSELTGVPATTIEDILSYLENQQQIRQQKTTKFRLVTIIKWNNYQKSVITSDSKPSTERQQSDTINKGNKDNNDNKDTAAKPPDEVNLLISVFQPLNPGINYGNTTNRKAAEWLIKEYGFEKAKTTAEFAIKCSGQPYAPIITTPYQLKENLGKLIAFYKRQTTEKSQKKGYLIL